MEESNLIEIIDCKQPAIWNKIVKSFKKWDIYYLAEYAESFRLHGDGEPLLIYFQDRNSRFCYVVMKRDIADSLLFNKILEKEQYFDFETPYGYGGPLSDFVIPCVSQKLFLKELSDYCLKNCVVSQFVRFHPLLDNQELLSDVIETRYLRDTIYMDLTSSDVIFSNMDSKNRNMVRKARKNGVTIKVVGIEDYQDFIKMYNDTMKRDNADDYYIFDENYFESLKKLKDNACIFYAVFEEKPIGGSIFCFNANYMHYHLSGTYGEYRKLASGNLLLYEAACWGSERGIKRFHLGGGMNQDDSLFSFKKQFNKNGRLPFVVGRTIFNIESYNFLMQLRKKVDNSFDMNNRFMIQYRQP